jgi:hypothetical protein
MGEKRANIEQNQKTDLGVDNKTEKDGSAPMTISLFTSRPTRKTTHLRLLTPGK